MISIAPHKAFELVKDFVEKETINDCSRDRKTLQINAIFVGFFRVKDTWFPPGRHPRSKITSNWSRSAMKYINDG